MNNDNVKNINGLNLTTINKSNFISFDTEIKVGVVIYNDYYIIYIDDNDMAVDYKHLPFKYTTTAENLGNIINTILETDDDSEDYHYRDIVKQHRLYQYNADLTLLEYNEYRNGVKKIFFMTSDIQKYKENSDRIIDFIYGLSDGFDYDSIKEIIEAVFIDDMEEKLVNSICDIIGDYSYLNIDDYSKIFKSVVEKLGDNKK